MDDGQKNPTDTLILIPTSKIYVFSYSRQTDGLTDGQTEKSIRCGLGNLIGSSKSIWCGLGNLGNWFLQVKVYVFLDQIFTKLAT
jgi:hypothetical protein